jgi:hypothetical protein
MRLRHEKAREAGEAREAREARYLELKANFEVR